MYCPMCYEEFINIADLISHAESDDCDMTAERLKNVGIINNNVDHEVAASADSRQPKED